MRLSFAILLGISLMACQNNQAQSSKPTTDSAKKANPMSRVETTVSAGTVQKWNRFCDLLSGDTTKITSNLKNASIWLSYSRGTNIKWNSLSKRISTPIAKWVVDSKLGIDNEPKTLVYPFAGGDFYYSHMFFPKQDTTIMVGLEPAGYLFDIDTASPIKLEKYLSNLEHSLYFPHKLGFFRTYSMEIDFTKGYLNGTIHTCLYYMAKFGYSIEYIKAFDIDAFGNPVKEVELGNKPHKKIAIRIGYKAKDGSGNVKELIYITGDLSDQGMTNGTKNSGLYIYLNSRKQIVSFFKAASYLMHKSSFSKIRAIMTQNSKRILQDDSGIPFAILKSTGFQVAVLGEYTRTIQLFRSRVQQDLKAEYAVKKPAKLPFNIGYNAEFKECNLQSAVKK